MRTIEFITFDLIPSHFVEKLQLNRISELGVTFNFYLCHNIKFDNESVSKYYSGSEQLIPKIKCSKEIFEYDDILRIADSFVESKNIVWLIGSDLSHIDFYEKGLITVFKKNKVKYIIKEFEILRYLNLGNKFKDFIKDYILRLKYEALYPPAYVIVSGKRVHSWANFILPRSKVLRIKSPKIFEPKIPPSEDQLYFIDEAMISTPDGNLHSFVPCHDIEGYYGRMNSLMSSIERSIGKRFQILCSNKFIYRDNPYEGRNLVYGETLSRLVDAKLVLGHSSSAIDQALFLRKNIIILIDISFDAVTIKDIKNYAKRFKIKKVFLTSNSDEIINSLSMSEYTSDSVINDYFMDSKVDIPYIDMIKELVSYDSKK